MPSAPKKTFADKLADTYRDVPLPAVYWRFFSEGEYLRYPKAFVPNIAHQHIVVLRHEPGRATS